MSGYKYHMGNKFNTCRLIGKAWDEHRKRDVSIFHIPGNFDYVGVHDGVDSWIAPVIANPFRGLEKRQLDRIRDGLEPFPIRPSSGPPKERRIVTTPKITELQPPITRQRKTVFIDPVLQQLTRSRHVVQR